MCSTGVPSQPPSSSSANSSPSRSTPNQSSRPRQLNRTTSINSGTVLAGSPTRLASPLASSNQSQAHPQQPTTRTTTTPKATTSPQLNLVGMNVHGTFNNQQDILHWMKKPLFAREGEVNGFLSGKDAAEKLQNESTRRDPFQYDYFESLKESTEALAPIFEKHPRTAWVMKQLMEPELFVSFRIPWTDDANNTRINRGYRVLYSTTPGVAYRGPLVFSRKLSHGAMRMLAFEQTMKNALSASLAGGEPWACVRGFAGGADLDVAGKSQEELRRFMHAYVRACLPFLSTKKKVTLDRGYPGVNVTREMGEYMLSGYKKEVDPLITGEDLFSFGGDFSWADAAHGARFAAHLAERALASAKGGSLRGKRCMISGLDERSLATAKVLAGSEFGALVTCLSDSTGTLVDSDGLSEEALELMMRHFVSAAASSGGVAVRDLKRVSPTSRFLAAAASSSSSSSSSSAASSWMLSPIATALPEGGVDVLFASSHNGDFSADDAAALVERSPRLQGVFELADRACTPHAIRLFESREVLFAPSKLLGASPPSRHAASLDLRRSAAALHDAVVLKGAEYGWGSSPALLRHGAVVAAFDRLAQDEKVLS